MIKISLSFDDGRIDQYRTFMNILKDRNIKATINITTGYIEETVSRDDYPSDNKNMSISNLKSISEIDLFEISGHGKKHNNDIDNYIDGLADLKRILGSSYILKGVASPQCRLDLNKISDYKTKLDNYNIKYIRTGDRFFKHAFLKKILRKINILLKSSIIYNYVYSDSNVIEDDSYILHSAIVTKNDTINMMKKFIEYAIKNNKSYILMFHSILKKNEDFYNDKYSWDYDDFCEFCDYLKKLETNKKIEIVKDSEMFDWS